MYLAKAQQALVLRRLDKALALFDQAQAVGEPPDACAAGKWESYMLLGEYEAAWSQSDLLRSSKTPDVHRLWKGEALRGQRVIVRCLHGFGDAIQFLRFAPPLREQASELSIQVAPALMELANQLDGVAPVTTWDDPSTPAPDWDVQVEIMQLPYLFRAACNALPPTPYLRIPAGDRRRLEELILRNEAEPGLPRVGLCSRCGSWNNSRAIPMHLLQPLVNTNAFQFYNLNDANGLDPWDGLTVSTRCHDAATLGAGPYALAAVIANMDLVITVDTMAAHIAGAMGKPVWLLLQYAADWRWMQLRADSPWYPSMHIFRQCQTGCWQSVVSEVSHQLTSYFSQSEADNA